MPIRKEAGSSTGVIDVPGPRVQLNGHEPQVPAKATVMLLRLLRAAQPISRAELARRVGVNRSTVTDAFKQLIAASVVREEPAEQPAPGANRALGRPALALSFNDEYGYFVGVNVGVRRSTVGLATLTGRVIAEEEFETPPEPSDALALIRATITKHCTRARGPRLRAIGVSVPGLADAAREKIVYAPHLGWQDVDVAGALRFDSGGAPCLAGERVRVVVENDATASALYELRLRLGRDESERLDDFVLLRSGTGLGVGLVLGGEVFRGDAIGEGLAGEFGHMTIVAGGKPCVCGNRGCWERYASAPAAAALYMGERMQMGGQTAPRFVEIVARAEGGELRAQRTLERVGEYLGIGIGNVITGLGVTRVIVSGRLVYGWKFMREQINNAVAQSMAGRLHGWSVEPGEATGAGLGGALEVAAEGFITSGLV
ncbi:MAG TPA: ROK family transcriptional regulator [Pyrinomonadaceae bacterium]